MTSAAAQRFGPQPVLLDDQAWQAELRRHVIKTDVNYRLADQARNHLPTFIQFVMRRERITKRELDECQRAGRKPNWHILLSPIQLRMLDFLLDTPRAVVRAAVMMGKSNIVTIAAQLWFAGRDPRGHNGKISSLKYDFATAFTRTIKSYVESSDALHMVFPHMVPGHKWTEGELYMPRPGEGEPVHPHWLAVGSEGKQQGKRVSLDTGDDIQDRASTSSEEKSDETMAWWLEGEGRMWEGGYRWLICNPHKPYDMGHKLVQDPDLGYKLFLLAARDGNGKTTLPIVWTQAMIDAYPESLKGRHLDGKADSASDLAFNPAYIYNCKRQGKGLTLQPDMSQWQLPSGMRIMCGVDMMHGKHNKDMPVRGRKKKTDDTVLFVCLVGHRGHFGLLFGEDVEKRLPPTTAEFICPVFIVRGKMEEPELKGWFGEIDRRFPGVIFVVEDIGAQGKTIQDLNVTDLAGRLVPFTTGPYKHDVVDGVIGINIDMNQRLFIIPCSVADDSADPENPTLVCEPEVQRWVDEMTTFSRSAHTGDSLAACFFVRNHARRLPTGNNAVGGIDMRQNVAERVAALTGAVSITPDISRAIATRITQNQAPPVALTTTPSPSKDPNKSPIRF